MRRAAAAWALLGLCALVAAVDTGALAAGGGTQAGGGGAKPTGGGASAIAPATPALRVVLDPSPAAGVLAEWRRGNRDPHALDRVASGIAYRTLRMQLGEQSGCDVTDRELQRALANPDSGACGFGLHPAWEQRAALDSLVRAIRAGRSRIAARAARRASRYVPVVKPGRDSTAAGDSAVARGPSRGSLDVRISFVLASQFTFDAITFDRDADGVTAPLVIVNLTDVLPYGSNTRTRIAALEHVLAHETFHAGLHGVRQRLAGWREFSARPRTALVHIAGAMADEGVAHFVDWRDRPGADTLFTAAPGPRERHAFAQLALAVRRLRGASPGSAEWEEILQIASTGPLWSKYAAISGMFVASRIERTLGRGALLRALAAGPPAFLRTYADLAAQDTTWKALPVELVDMK